MKEIKKTVVADKDENKANVENKENSMSENYSGMNQLGSIMTLCIENNTGSKAISDFKKTKFDSGKK